MEKTYVAIDLKSFYASVECVERQLDPLNTNLVVADESRTEKTICLAVSPSLKSFGISGRARLFEVIQRVEQVNKERLQKAPKRQFAKKSYIYSELSDPACELDYIVATPQMAKYLAVSAKIYGIYLKYVSPEDIFAYSIDEVFIDATGYLGLYNVDGRGFAVSGGVAKAVADVIHKLDPEREVKVVSAQGLKDCRKLLTLAKAGKYDGYLLEGMACPGGCVAGAGTLQAVEKSTALVNKYVKDAPLQNSLDSKYEINLDLITEPHDDK